jgi:hypothetical protein
MDSSAASGNVCTLGAVATGGCPCGGAGNCSSTGRSAIWRPVQDDNKLATSKQLPRDNTKRRKSLFMGFLLHLLVVVLTDKPRIISAVASSSFLDQNLW